MSDIFYRITRCIVEENGCQRLTETRVTGYYTQDNVEHIVACRGKSIIYSPNKEKLSDKAA